MRYDLKQLKTAENLQRYCDQELVRRGPRSYNCPICGSGTGPKGTAAFNLDGEGYYTCFSCNNHGDLLDLIGAVEGIDGFEDRARRAAEFCGMEADVSTRHTPAKVTPYTPKTDHAKGREREAATVSEFVAAYPGSRGEEYAKERGIDQYPLVYGYDAKRQRLVIKWPDCDWYHIDRDITGDALHKYEKPRAAIVGKQPLFASGKMRYYDVKGTRRDANLVVVEGALDAGAVAYADAGQSAGDFAIVALCGTGYRDLLTKLTNENFKGGVVLMLDNDDAGRATSAKLHTELEEAGIAAYEFPWAEGDPKDADEMVQAGKIGKLCKRMRHALATAADMARNAEPSPNVRLVDPFEVAEHIFLEDDADTPIPTGIGNLDRMIGGGLMRGLYVLGATSSFGKTTISVQVADHVANSGHPALFVTIEQSATEIVAKSLSRLTHDRHNSVSGGLTAQEITTSTKRRGWGADKHETLTTAISAYTAETAPNLRIMEGITKPSVAEIRQAAKDVETEFGEPPVILIDYLQLLAPADERMSDKQAVDHNITALRILARDLKTPVWCVATLNRESYSGPVDLDSFKESGAIEYGCDYAFGLQPQGIAAEVQSVKSAVEKKLRGNAYISKAKRDNPRKVELTVLKNRQGETTGTDGGIPLIYYPRTNLFVGSE